MIALFMSIVLSAMGSAVKTGGLPPMLLNPDSVVAAASGGLPSNLGTVFDQVMALPGATFGLGVVDLNTEERLTRNASRRFFIDTPDIVNAAVCVSRNNSGAFPLDSLVARDEQLWQVAARGQQGSREATQSIIYYMGGIERVESWLASSGHSTTKFTGVQLDWGGAPDVEPSYTTVNDCLDFIEIVAGSLDNAAVRRMTKTPPLSADLQATLGTSNVIYGWVSGRGTNRSLNFIISRPDGAKYGITVLANDLCCFAKADLGFSMIWDAL
jgi:hypothetical protein